MQQLKSVWMPDTSLFEQVEGDLWGVLRVKKALKEVGLELGKRIITSRDREVLSLREKLRIVTMPIGFEQYQLPILIPGENSMYFLTFGQPNAKFPEHCHTQDDGFRLIISGSLFYENVELTAGDWIYVPHGCTYSFQVGPSGCTIFHEYGPEISF